MLFSFEQALETHIVLQSYKNVTQRLVKENHIFIHGIIEQALVKYDQENS